GRPAFCAPLPGGCARAVAPRASVSARAEPEPVGEPSSLTRSLALVLDRPAGDLGRTRCGKGRERHTARGQMPLDVADVAADARARADGPLESGEGGDAAGFEELVGDHARLHSRKAATNDSRSGAGMSSGTSRPVSATV